MEVDNSNENIQHSKVTEVIKTVPIDIFKNMEISLAPMLEVTTANFRRFIRLTSKHTILFTEMIVSNTVFYISREKLYERLGYIDDCTVVQLGGSDPQEISSAISILQQIGCKHFNLNVGCPSLRVKKGCFGAVLMKNKSLVADIVNTVQNLCNTIISLKIRVGVDELDSYEFFYDFVSHLVRNTSITTFYVHGRKCWLEGLSPKQNRNIPSLNYDYIYRIKEEFPHINFILNGGLKGVKNFNKLSNGKVLLDGMMIGREAIKNILVFKEIEEYLYGPCNFSVKSIIKKYLENFDLSCPISFKILNPLQHILHGIKGTKKWKIFLNDSVHKSKLCIKDFIKEMESINFFKN